MIVEGKDNSQLSSPSHYSDNYYIISMFMFASVEHPFHIKCGLKTTVLKKVKK